MVAADSVYSGCGLEHTGCGAWIFFEGRSKPVKNMNRRVANRRQIVLEWRVCGGSQAGQGSGCQAQMEKWDWIPETGGMPDRCWGWGEGPRRDPWGTLGKEGGPAKRMAFAPTFTPANYLIMNPANMA